jgi:His/Glu/Gln/Arg/opine family amino acid ABC transporter permease subunit
MMVNYKLIFNSIPALLHGMELTLIISFFSLCIGVFAGIPLGVLHTSKSSMVRKCVSVYVECIRGTPMLIHILFIFYVLPQFNIHIPALLSSIIAIGINSSAYVSQIFRGGIQAISKGQLEAAKVLGFSKLQAYQYILLPQAFKIAFPSLNNECITLIKDSSLASIIGVLEITKQASIIRSRTYDPFNILLLVTILYLSMTLLVSWTLKKIEQKL